LLLASADFMNGNARVSARGAEYEVGSGLTKTYRFNNEQGYGRIKLDNVLPLQTWPAGASGLAMVDGGIDGGAMGITGLDGVLDAAAGEIDEGSFEVCNANEELRIALTWIEPAGANLVNDLNLEIVSPSGATYFGNYFTDDDNRDGAIDPNGEDCPGIDGRTGEIDGSEWSHPVCQRTDMSVSPHDYQNPTEAVMLSPDPLNSGEFGQVQEGAWTVRVVGSSGVSTSQRYALVVAGGVCSGSWIRFENPSYVCNARTSVTVTEYPEFGDVDPSESDVSERTVVQVLDGETVVDEERGLLFERIGSTDRQYTSESVYLTDATAPDPGNGVLDVRHGNTLRVVYWDVGVDGVTPDPNRRRTGESRVDCATSIAYATSSFQQFGRNRFYLVSGGCERNLRGNFEFGFPDRYMDAGELVTLDILFGSTEYEDAENVEADLRCVIPDADSPRDCQPGSAACQDPDRTNNPSCDQRSTGHPDDDRYMTILDTPKVIGLMAARSVIALGFSVRMEDSLTGTPEIEMLLSVKAPSSGKTEAGAIVFRQTLDVDEQSLLYSTDFPTGGTEFIDVQNNETLENPTTSIASLLDDYVFETRTYSDLTDGGTKNLGLQSPWNFDTNDGGFRSGLLVMTDESTITNTIAQWGEDKNFNSIDDKRCTDDIGRSCYRDSDCVAGTCISVEQRDPADNVLDKSWNIRGGCGWQTKPPGTCASLSTQGCFDDGDCPVGDTCTGSSHTGGIWHTGRIGGTVGNCLVIGNNPGQCQAYETVGGTTGLRYWYEALVTPLIQKVNGPEFQAEIVQWRWNQAIDLADDLAAFFWEFDTDANTTSTGNLYGDGFFLGGIRGPYGAVEGVGDAWGDGFGMFAPLDSARLHSANGTIGFNREGKNACYFEGGAVSVEASQHLGLAWPPDDDIDNDGDGIVDELVSVNGPMRNMDLSFGDGFDMRYEILPDWYGAQAGELFQGAFTFRNQEKSEPSSLDPRLGYGVGIDDVVVEWREYRLAEDESDCATGECAVLSISQKSVFEGNTILSMTVLDKSPDPTNDCDLNCLPPMAFQCGAGMTYCQGGPDDGATCDVDVVDSCPEGECMNFSSQCAPLCFEGGPTGPRDCDADGISDLVVRVVSESEPQGEIVFLNRTENPWEFRGSLPTSATYDASGVLHLKKIGEGFYPVVTGIYRDNDDGTGQMCSNHMDLALQGYVQDSATLYLLTGEISVISTVLTDNGDGDGFPDTNETVDMRIRVRNPGVRPVTGLVARLSTDDPKIDCILDTLISVGDIAPKAEVLTADAFTFRVGDVDRSDQGLTDFDSFGATFEVLFSSDQFDNTATPQVVTIDLDLDAIGGSGPTTLFEGFESGTFGAFTPMNLDAGRNTLEASDGYRCQYVDPDWRMSNNYGLETTSECYLGASPAHADAYYWQVHTPSAIDGGRAYSGSHSLYMGIFGPAADEHTTPIGVLEAIRSEDPINLGFLGASPELSIKHQVDFMDDRHIGATLGPNTSLTRGVVQLQLADEAGNPASEWIKLYPNINSYDKQGAVWPWWCMFDPVDDGNTEDDFFEPDDPERILGPSSTCYPEFVFANIGETFGPYAEDNLGRAEGPGLRGTLGLGTWIESRFNLERFRGRRVRIRFLDADVVAWGNETWEQVWWADAGAHFNPRPGDDGWWIDDIQITNTLVTPATITNDDKDNSHLPACGNTCNVVSASLVADPPMLPAPGQVVELSARDAVADRCLDGLLQFRYWLDENGDGSGNGPTDLLLRNWTDVPEMIHAPSATTSYVVDVRCSSDPACADSAAITLPVDCPSSGRLGGFPEVLAASNNELAWELSLAYDFSMGSLDDLSSYATLDEGQGLGPAVTFDISGDDPATGTGFWYVFRRPGALGEGTGYCNDAGITWGNPSRDGVLP